MKKIITINITILIIIPLIFFLFLTYPHESKQEIKFRVNSNNKIEFKDYNNKWKIFNMIGINMGTGYPNVFPNDFDIKKEVYRNWFEKIGNMNVNTIRVYQMQSPDFYKAFSEYNKTHNHKLYLLQGINYNEELMNTNDNILEDKFMKDVIYKESNNTIKAVHGDLVYFDSKRDYFATYSTDISDYLIGYTLGIEWDKTFVDFNNTYNHGMLPFNGNYLYCSNDARPFENFLAQWGDYVFSHENKKYKEQPLISFCNWTDTDPLINEVHPKAIDSADIENLKNSEVTINTNVINMKNNVKSGIFASYNIYPYHPMFLQYGEYTKYIDETKKPNSYRKYLSELVEFHNCPVVITEYGVPTSRNEAYGDVLRGFSHGGLNEKEQGYAIKTLFYDIKKSGCVGSILFSWQDEWSKSTWNEFIISDPNRRNKWSNTQSVEQSFGLLSFDPGKSYINCYPDGNYTEWKKDDLIYENKDKKLSMKSDERFVYFYIDGADLRKGKNKINLAIDTHPKIGENQQGIHKFKNGVDFILEVKDNKTSNLYVEKDYDINIYSMVVKSKVNSSVINLTEQYKIYENLTKNDNLDSNFKIITRAGSDLNAYKKNRFYSLIKVGKLVHGNGNPKSKSFNSNADYYINGDKIEIRIPWQLLGFRDPSSSIIFDDFKSNNYSIKNRRINNIKVAMYYDDTKEVNNFEKYKLKTWNKPKFHERLKESYYIMKEVFRRESNAN